MLNKLESFEFQRNHRIASEPTRSNRGMCQMFGTSWILRILAIWENHVEMYKIIKQTKAHSKDHKSKTNLPEHGKTEKVSLLYLPTKAAIST